DDFVAVPDFSVFAEFAFEHADGPRAANIVGHQHIGIDPHVVAGFNAGFSRRAGQNFLSQRHTIRSENLPDGASGRKLIKWRFCPRSEQRADDCAGEVTYHSDANFMVVERTPLLKKSMSLRLLRQD